MEHQGRDATYRIFEKGSGFAIEVTIPDMQPITVTPFASRAAANQWIARHKEAAARYDPSKPQPRLSFRQKQKMADA